MQLNSGTGIASLKVDNIEVVIRVCGDVRVDYDNVRYSQPSAFPDELLELFKTGKAWADNGVDIDMNNWFEIFTYIDDKFAGSDVFDANDYLPPTLFQALWDQYQDAKSWEM